MYILDKNKDYYDFVSHIYGVDKSITYDRRGSIVLDTEMLLSVVFRHNFVTMQNQSHYRTGSYYGDLFTLEVGDVQYLFMVNNLKFKFMEPDGYGIPIDADFSLIKAWNDHKHYYEKEITIVPARENTIANWRVIEKKRGMGIMNYSYSDFRIDIDHAISNPILDRTPIPSFIDPKDMYINLSNYISSKYNDKTVAIVNSDTDKVVNHGFDTKTSFRNPIKL